MSSVKGRLAAPVILALALLPQAASGHLASPQSPPPVGGAPPTQDPVKSSCSKVRTRPTGVIPEPAYYKPYCGSARSDVMRSTLGHYYIGGSSGNDVIKTTNRKLDVISGGPGRDQAVIDKYDVFWRGTARASGIEKCRPVATCRAVSSTYARAKASELQYPYQLASIQCQRNTTGTSAPYILRFAEEPTIRAADSTQHADWQTVAWSAVLNSWDGSQWVYAGQLTSWLWDRAPDKQFDSTAGFSGNYWRRFDTGQRAFVYLPATAGIYRAAIHYYWYPTPTAPVHDLFVWGGRHFGEFADSTEGWCVFPP